MSCLKPGEGVWHESLLGWFQCVVNPACAGNEGGLKYLLAGNEPGRATVVFIAKAMQDCPAHG